MKSLAYAALDSIPGKKYLGNLICNPDLLWLEYDKIRAHEFLTNLGILMPQSAVIENINDLIRVSKPFVVKFLTSNKSGNQTVIVKTVNDYKLMFESYKKFPGPVLLQQFLSGPEYTITILAGEQNWILMGTARDYKQLYNNQGPNSFGMGSISPVKFNNLVFDCIDTVFSTKTIQGLVSFQFLEYANKPYLLEINQRLCDPEFQSMAVNLGPELWDRITEAQTGQYIKPLKIGNWNSVTIGLVHTDYDHGDHSVELELGPHPFIFYKNTSVFDSLRPYYGSFTNFGSKQHAELAKELYDYLESMDISPYRYRTDIGTTVPL